MRRVVLGWLLGFACFACAQQPVGDVYESGGASAETPAQAVQNLYKITATITGDPSSGYDAKTDHWPQADAAWQQWDNSIPNGNAVLQQQRTELAPCAADLGAALDAMERGYRIQISQEGNAPAQAAAQQDYAKGRSEFAQCSLADALNGSNGNPGPGSQSGGSGAPIQGGVSTGSNGTPPPTGGNAPPPAAGSPPGTKSLTRSPTSGTPTSGGPTSGTPAGTPAPAKPATPPPNMAAIDKTIETCLNKYEPYLNVQSLQPAYMQMALYSAPPSVKAVPFAQLPSQSQIFLEESAWALQVQATHDAKYGGNEYNPAQAQDYMVGWLDLCLFWSNRQPSDFGKAAPDPRDEYANYLGVPLMDNRIDIFSNGGQEFFLPPLPLMPPRTPPPSL
jgi:hypothetical protein